MKDKPEVILVDVGNSAIKTTEVVNQTFQQMRTWKEDLSVVLEYFQEYPLAISSVREIGFTLDSDRILLLSHRTNLPIQLDYDTPETLGADRIAAAVGAHSLFPSRHNIIVDLGTCMTIDLITKEGVFKGGVISPGLKMRMKAMAEYTDQLPDISLEWESIGSEVIGKTTKECLYSGSYWGILHEINSVLKTLEKDFTSLNMIITGGDAHYFESSLKAHIFAGSKIVQEGLYRIWKHQS